MSRVRRIKTLEGRLEALVKDLQTLKTEPIEPTGDPFADHPPVVYFKKTFGPSDGTPYTYAAIKAAGRWWVTGKTMRSFSWEELLDFADTAVVTMREAYDWRKLEVKS